MEIMQAQTDVILAGLSPKIDNAKVEEPPVVQVECDSCHEMEDEDMSHRYGDATFCDSCYEGCIA